jgi:hypothetical protein
MNQDHIYIEIDQKNTIQFDLQTKLNDVFRYVETEIILCIKDQTETLLFDDFLIVGLRELQWPLKQLLTGDFKLHPSITENIGYLWDEYLHDVELPSETDSKGHAFWVGSKYLVWNSARSKTATWLYENNGKFWFEVTPGYPWHFEEPKEGESLEPYEEFMNNYRPIALFELSRETLEA